MIDVLRGVAAWVVLIWHYNHFFRLAPGVSVLTDPSAQPFYQWLWPFYDHGHQAVQFFWVISGFVFSAVYLQTRRISGYSFFINRLARLYPLHLITLATVAVLQSLSLVFSGHAQIYPNTDVYHLLLNLGFASSWGVERGFSFNAPIWSVSAEILVYFAFVLTSALLRSRVWLAAAFSALLLVLSTISGPVAVLECGAYFYAGVCVFGFIQSLSRAETPVQFVSGVVAGAIVLCFLYVVLATVGSGTAKLVALYSGVVLLAAIAERVRRLRLWCGKIKLLGDLTYSLYLWHVPLQIMVLIYFDVVGVDRTIATQPLFFIGYAAAVHAVAYFSFHFIEKPARAYVRQRWDPAARSSAAAALLARADVADHASTGMSR